MSNNRLLTKARRTYKFAGLPPNTEGRDGDFAISTHDRGVALYVKFNNHWHRVSALEKTAARGAGKPTYLEDKEFKEVKARYSKVDGKLDVDLIRVDGSTISGDGFAGSEESNVTITIDPKGAGIIDLQGSIKMPTPSKSDNYTYFLCMNDPTVNTIGYKTSAEIVADGGGGTVTTSGASNDANEIVMFSGSTAITSAESGNAKLVFVDTDQADAGSGYANLRILSDGTNYTQLLASPNGALAFYSNDAGALESGSMLFDPDAGFLILTSMAFKTNNTTYGDGEIDQSSGDLTLDAAGDITLDADGDQIIMKWGGATGQIDFTNENSGDGVIQQKIDGKDLVIKQYDGNEVIRFTDGGDVKFTNSAYFLAQAATGAGGGTTNIDWSLGNKYHFTFGAGNETIRFTGNPVGPCNLLLKMTQDGSGSRLVTDWVAHVADSDIYWAGGGEGGTDDPVLTTTIGFTDIISFYFDGEDYFGSASMNFDTA